MEMAIYIFMPMALLFRLFETKKETGFELFTKYLGLCFINNIICILLIKNYWTNFDYLNTKLVFILKYSGMAFVVGLGMALIYRIFVNLLQVRLEVVKDEKNSKKTK